MHGWRDTLRAPLFTVVDEARAANDTFGRGDHPRALERGPSPTARPPASSLYATMLPSAPTPTMRVRGIAPDVSPFDGPDESEHWHPSRADSHETITRLLRLSLTDLVNHYGRRARAR